MVRLDGTLFGEGRSAVRRPEDPHVKRADARERLIDSTA